MALDVLDDRCEVLVLGIGNILWADEGFGPRCVEHFHRLYEDRPEVRVEAGGTLGFYLARRPEGAEVAPLMAACVEEAPYEEGRPCEAEACRIGDERFLVRPAGVHVEDPSFERK